METKTIKMEVPYFQVANDIFEIGLSNNEILVYIYLARCSNNSTAFPSYKTIGEKTGISRDTAIRVMKKLENKNLIYKETRKFIKETDDKQKVFNKSNVYYLEHDLSKFKSLGGSTQPLPLVAQNDHPSSTVQPYKELLNNNYLDKELIVKRSSQKNDALSNYKNKTEYIIFFIIAFFKCHYNICSIFTKFCRYSCKLYTFNKVCFNFPLKEHRINTLEFSGFITLCENII